ncbi:MAG TPA: FAD-binding oxidoreductase [Solirubrobacteraceae bacterium]|nr:FAD-binding oxidoreductase [Solirubrobacteraceae bacterium]
MLHDPHGFWITEAGSPKVLPALEGDQRADVVVVGGGYTGLWTAWHVLDAEPDANVVVLERSRCGHGPSGRNGGFVTGMDLSLPALRREYGDAAAEDWVAAARDTVDALGAWCDAEGVDAWYREGGELVVSTAPAQEGGVGADAADGISVVAQTPEQARARCASPVFRAGVFVPAAATVQPARLAFGLRERLRVRGAKIYEGSRATGMRPAPEGVSVRTASGQVRARTAVFAMNAASGTLRPLRNRLTVSSSHIVCTEPVPDVIEQLGWEGGEAISDGRALLHYTRTTRDARIVFGWAGGRMAAGARPGGRMEVDHEVVAQLRADLLRFFPQLAGRRIAHAWGGPIDVSPTHRPAIVGLRGLPAWAGFGYTGNGVGPAHLFGRALAALALDRRDPVTRLPFVDPPPRHVPPEPLRIAGAALIRRALVRKEAAEEAGGRPDPLTAGVAALPRLFGLHIVR